MWSEEETLAMRLVWPFARLLEKAAPLGVELTAWQRIARVEFGDPNARVPARVAAEGLAAALVWTQDPTLGLRAGAEIDSADLGCLELAARSSSTAGDAICLVSRHVRLLHEDARAELTVEGGLATWHFWLASGTEPAPQASDFIVTAATGFLRRNVPVYVAPREVRLRHARPPYADQYARYLGAAEVTFGASETAIVFRKDLLDAKMVHANAPLSHAFELHLHRSARAREARIGATRRAHEVVARQLRGGEVSMRRAARELAMSVSTLRRRLAEEGTTFSHIVTTLRVELAQAHLREAGSTVSEVAERLAFADVATFSRAFKRWNGVTPTQFRSAKDSAPVESVVMS